MTVVFKRSAAFVGSLVKLTLTLVIFIKSTSYRVISTSRTYTSAPSSMDFSGGSYYTESEFIVGFSIIDIGKVNSNNLGLWFELNPWSDRNVELISKNPALLTTA